MQCCAGVVCISGLFGLVIPVAGYATPEVEPSVRLPAIYHVWQPEGVSDKPEITMEEVERCLGKDMKIRQSHETFKAEASLLEKEAAEFEQLAQSVSAERDAIDDEIKAMNAETALMNNHASELDRDHGELAALASAKKTDAETARHVNARIGSHNAQVKAHNAAVAAFKQRSLHLQEKRQKFNLKISAIKEKLDAFNVKAEEFKSRNKGYEDIFASYKEKCAGERQFVK